MAGIKTGPLIGAISGSVGGQTFARNRFGFYVRARTTPVNPNTSLQQTVRNALATLTTRWSATLNVAQRTAWNLYGNSVVMKNKLGEDVWLTGFNHYLRSNVPLLQFGKAPVDDGPTVFELPAHDPTYAVTMSEATQQITTTFDNAMAWAVEDGGFMFMYQGSPQNFQRNFFAGPWRAFASVVGIDPGGAVTPSVDAVRFAVAEGQKDWCYSRIGRADGRLSEPFRDDTLVAA